MWVNTADSKLCSLPRDPCEEAGTYNRDDSSTSKVVSEGFNISYADGSGAAGDYVTDTFRIGSANISDFQFGIGETSSSQRGILGLGYDLNEVQVLSERKDPYDNLPLKLAADGHIQSPAYSIYLNDFEASRGSILFGGVDSSRYEGDLSTLPIQSESGLYQRFLVTLTKVEFGDETVEDDMALAVLLDSGTSITYLPDNMVADIFERVGAEYSRSEDLAFISCSARSASESLRFTFSGAVIEVSMSELVLDVAGLTRGQSLLDEEEEVCIFGIGPAGEGSNVLGDTFMRSAYVVFDLENNEISMAQTRANSSESDVREITEDGVPGATKVKDPVQATKGLVDGGQAGVSGRECSVLGAGAAALLVGLTLW